MELIVKCIKKLVVYKTYPNGSLIFGEQSTIKEGTVWIVKETYNGGNPFQLYAENGDRLEIYLETFLKHFA